MTLTKRHSATGHYTHGVRLGLHRDVIVAGFFDKIVDVWRRNSSDLNQNLENTRDVITKVQTVEVESNVYVVKVNIRLIPPHFKEEKLLYLLTVLKFVQKTSKDKKGSQNVHPIKLHTNFF